MMQRERERKEYPSSSERTTLHRDCQMSTQVPVPRTTLVLPIHMHICCPRRRQTTTSPRPSTPAFSPLKSISSPVPIPAYSSRCRALDAHHQSSAYRTCIVCQIAEGTSSVSLHHSFLTPTSRTLRQRRVPRGGCRHTLAISRAERHALTLHSVACGYLTPDR